MSTLTAMPHPFADRLAYMQVAFPGEPRAIPAVRERARRAVSEWGYHPSVVDAVELVVTELASNALLHAAVPGSCGFEVVLAPGPYGLTVEVRDASPHLPIVVRVSEDEEHGRGLALVEALSLRWGASLGPWPGKRTWALIEAPPPDPPTLAAPTFNSLQTR